MDINVYLIAILAILHRLRGSDVPYTNKVVTSLASGVAAGLFTWDWIIGVIVAVGLYLFVVLGWGRGFAAIHGNDIAFSEPEIRPIDWLAKQIAGSWGNHAHGTVWMSLRGLLLLPLFVALSVYLKDWTVSLYGLSGLAKGPVYYLAGRVTQKYAVEVAEVVMGAIIGLAIVTATV